MQTQNIQTHQIALENIISNNYRKTFDEESIRELSESIRQQGLIQPITLRPYPGQAGKYELVAGERRLRASQLAGLGQITAFVRKLTDEQVAEMRLVENMHRLDVHPMEQADEILRLTLAGWKTTRLAAKLAKTERYITQCLSLTNLSPYWRDVFLQSGLSLKAALQIARLSPDNQAKLEGNFPRKNIEQDGKIVAAMSTSAIEAFIGKNIFLSLKGVAFPLDCPNLYPQAGACLNCQKRTGHNKMLFGELSQDDLCQDRACFTEKNGRFLSQQKAQLREANVPFLEVSSRHATGENVLSNYQYRQVAPEEFTPDCEPALVVEGEGPGRVIYIQRKSFEKETGTDDAQKLQERKRVLRREKIEKISRELSAQALLEAFIRGKEAFEEGNGDEAPYVKVLDQVIADRLGSGQNKDLSYFFERYGWKVPLDGGDTDTRRKGIRINIEETPSVRKLELLIDTFIHPMAQEAFGMRVVKLAADVGIDTRALTLQAEALVDGPSRYRTDQEKEGSDYPHEEVA